MCLRVDRAMVFWPYVALVEFWESNCHRLFQSCGKQVRRKQLLITFNYFSFIFLVSFLRALFGILFGAPTFLLCSLFIIWFSSGKVSFFLSSLSSSLLLSSILEGFSLLLLFQTVRQCFSFVRYMPYLFCHGVVHSSSFYSLGQQKISRRKRGGICNA